MLDPERGRPGGRLSRPPVRRQGREDRRHAATRPSPPTSCSRSGRPGPIRRRAQADLPRYRAGQVVIGLCDPLGEPQAAAELAARGVTLFALELLPRITRAQSMDVLSSQATIAGYRAVLLAATALPKMFPMLMTAAGTIAPAKVFVVGAGVAGLQAIATASRLGGVVSAYDVRPAVKEQVQSLGAKFVEMPLETAAAETKGGYAQQMDEEFYRKQRELMGRVVAESDVVITTAAVPGKKAPLLITAAMVEGMAPGSVMVDLAAERGGNCELTQPGKTIVHNGVTILGPLNLPSEVPYHASQLYAKNISTFLLALVREGSCSSTWRTRSSARRWWPATARWCMRTWRRCWASNIRRSGVVCPRKGDSPIFVDTKIGTVPRGPVGATPFLPVRSFTAIGRDLRLLQISICVALPGRKFVRVLGGLLQGGYRTRHQAGCRRVGKPFRNRSLPTGEPRINADKRGHKWIVIVHTEWSSSRYVEWKRAIRSADYADFRREGPKGEQPATFPSPFPPSAKICVICGSSIATWSEWDTLP